MLLRERGWVWKLFPRKLDARVGLLHLTDQEKGEWYTAGKSIIPSYAQCLLSSTHLRERYGIQTIPHCVAQPLQDYKRLSTGKPVMPLEVKRKALRAPLQQEFPDDMADGSEVLAIQDADDEGLEHQEQLEDEQWLAEGLENEEQLLQADLEQEEAAPEDEPQGDEENEDDVEATEPDSKRARRGGPLRIIQWGCFEIARKRVEGAERSFEIRCPFHRMNKKTRCVKTIEYKPDDEDHVLAVAYWWCNQAKLYDTQKMHRGCFKNLWEVPYHPLEVLQRDQITEAPAGYVETDAEVQARLAVERAQQNVASAQAKRRGRPRRKGDGQGSRGGRGRGKGGGRGSAEPAPDSSARGGARGSAELAADLSEMGSASSSSSSSS